MTGVTDILDRLREAAAYFYDPHVPGVRLLVEAADEIERLRQWQSDARDELIDIRLQWGVEHIWGKYHAKWVDDLLERVES